MTTKTRKVCLPGPTRKDVVRELLTKAGCEVVLGKNVDDFPDYRYQKNDLVNLVADSDAVVVTTRDVIGAEILDSCRNLQAVVKSSIGVENIDIEAASKLGVLVCNSPAPENFTGLAEATVGLMNALFKRLKQNEAHVRRGGWRATELRGELIVGKTIGLIGCGRVGRAVAKRLAGWEVRLIACDPYVSQEALDPLGVRLVSLEEVLRESDLVTIHVVLTAETRYMIGLKELKMMKSTAYLVNTARGAVINEADLVQALTERIIAGAALDVFEEEPLPMASRLRDVDPTRLILTPHIIGNNPQSLESGHRMAAESVLSILGGNAPSTVLNPMAIESWKAKFWS